MSSSSSSSSSSSLLPFFLQKQLQRDSSADTNAAEPASHTLLLTKCIQYLDTHSRIHLACTSPFFLSLCSSESSWLIGTSNAQLLLEQLDKELQSGERIVKGETNGRFQGPAVRCSINELHRYARNKIFLHARCIQLNWSANLSHVTNPIISQASAAVTADGLESISPRCNWCHLDDLLYFEQLEHLYLGAAALTLPIFNSHCADHGTHHPPPSLQLPSTLKSFAVDMEFSAKWNPTKLLDLLPTALRCLHLRFKGITRKCQFEPILKRLQSLQRIIISEVRLEIQDTPPDSIGPDIIMLNPHHHSSSLRIHCELVPTELLRTIMKNKPKDVRPLAPLMLFCAALTHLRLQTCKVFNEVSTTVDWSKCLPQLVSLHISELSNGAGQRLPKSISSRLKFLVVDKLNWVQDESSISVGPSAGDLLNRSDFEQLTSLTCDSIMFHLLKSDFFRGLSHLTHLSLGLLPMTNFDDFSRFPLLKTLELQAWPSECAQQTDQQLQPLSWKRIIEADIFTIAYSNSATDVEQHVSVESLAVKLPSLTELVVKWSATPCRSGAFNLRHFLRTIPHLSSVKWEQEPVLHPKQIESYYSLQAVQVRERNRVLQCIESNRQSAQFRPTNHSESASSDTAVSISSTSTVARDFNLFNLSLAFQALNPVEVSRASCVSRHWRSAALSPLVLRHPFRIEMHQLQGVKVHGPQVRIGSIIAMYQTCSSAVFRNLRILTLEPCKAPPLQRESDFANQYLRLIEHITKFVSLHTLSLNWSDNQLAHLGVGLLPTANDLASIREVMQSNALKHLKVFRIIAPPPIIYVILQFLPMLKSLEIVELRYLSGNLSLSGADFDESCRFAKPLLQLPKLTKVYICHYQHVTTLFQLNELSDLCQGVSSSFEEMMWRVPVTSAILKAIPRLRLKDAIVPFAKLKSIHIPVLNDNFNLLSDAYPAMPDLCDVSIGRVLLTTESQVARPLPAALSSRLRSLKMKVEVNATNENSVQGLAIFIQSLIASNLTQLECLHFLRGANGEGYDDEFEVRLIVQLINSCPNLTELNCPRTRLDTCWSRLLPRLRIVYFQTSISGQLFLCRELRELHSARMPSGEALEQLLQLPHFQSVTYSGPSGALIVQSRAEIARALAREPRLTRSIEAQSSFSDESQQPAQDLLLLSQIDDKCIGSADKPSSA